MQARENIEGKKKFDYEVQCLNIIQCAEIRRFEQIKTHYSFIGNFLSPQKYVCICFLHNMPLVNLLTFFKEHI